MKEKAHIIPEATLLTECLGEWGFYRYTKHGAKYYLILASLPAALGGSYFIMPVLGVRKVRHRVVKECALSHTVGGHMSFQPGSQVAELIPAALPGSSPPL